MRASFIAVRGRFITFLVSATGSAHAVNASSSILPADHEPNKQEAVVPPLAPESLYNNSVSATTLTGEAADRLATRKLVDAWVYPASSCQRVRWRSRHA